MTLDTWDAETLEVMHALGNAVVNKVYEAKLPPRPKPEGILLIVFVCMCVICMKKKK